MAEKFAWVDFPDGRRLYTGFSTVVDCVHWRLHEHYGEPGTSPEGFVLDRRKPIGDPLPSFPEKPLSAPCDMIVVQISVEDDRGCWPALYCPSQQKLIGPVHKHNRRRLQENMNLVRQDGLDHLAPQDYLKREFFDPGKTLCGLPVSGEVVPFWIGPDYPGRELEPPDPPERDLYAEWENPHVCKMCLLAPEAIDFDGERYRRRKLPVAEPPPAPRKSLWRRLFG